MTDLVAVRIADASYLVPSDVARRVAALHAAGDAYGAMVLARDAHVGGSSVVPPGGRVSVPMLFADHLPEHLKAGVHAMTTHTNLNDANAENNRLRPVLDAAALMAIADTAAQALRAEQIQRRNGTSYGRAVDRISNAWKAHHGA